MEPRLRLTAAVVRVNVADPREMLGPLVTAMAAGEGPWARLRLTDQMAVRGGSFGRLFDTASCEVARRTDPRLGLPESTQLALYPSTEGWKGGGAPHGLAGDAIDIAARVENCATGGRRPQSPAVTDDA